MMVLITAMVLCFQPLSAVQPTPLTHSAAQEWGEKLPLVRALLLTLQRLRHKQFRATHLQSQPQNKTVLIIFRGRIKLLTLKEKSWDMWQVQ